MVHVWSTDCFYSVRSAICSFMFTVKLKRSYLRSHWDSPPLKPARSKGRLPDQLLWSHSSRLQICSALVAYSSTISLWDAPTGPWAISPSGQSVKFTPQQVIVVDGGRLVLLWGKNYFWNTSWNSASPAATGCRSFDKWCFICYNLHAGSC